MEFHTGGKARELFRIIYPAAADSVRYRFNSEADSYIPEQIISGNYSLDERSREYMTESVWDCQTGFVIQNF